MKITKRQLKQIIKEELGRVLIEFEGPRVKLPQPVADFSADYASFFSPALRDDYEYYFNNPPTYGEMMAVQQAIGQEARGRIGKSYSDASEQDASRRGAQGRKFFGPAGEDIGRAIGRFPSPSELGATLAQTGAEFNPFHDPSTGRTAMDAYTPAMVSALKKMRGEELPELDQTSPIEEAAKVRRTRKK